MKQDKSYTAVNSVLTQKLLHELTLPRKPWYHLLSLHEKLKLTRQQSMKKCNTLPCNHCFSAKVISMTYSRCACVALGIQHAVRICHIVICDLADSTRFFCIISQTADFWKIFVEHKMGILIFSPTLSEIFLILRKIQRDIINKHRQSCKISIILVKF